jgi:anti-sigma B factor antagonist
MDVRVAEHAASGCTVVTVSGQLDMETAPRLEAALYPLLDGGVRRIVVDLADLSFCDSIGLSTLFVAHRSCVDGGGFLRLARPTPFLLNLLGVVGARETMGVYDSVGAACAGEPVRT